MLSPRSWQDKAEALDLYERLRTNHDCGPGRTLTLRKDDKGLHAYCFRCNDHGWLPPAPVPLAVRLERLQRKREADDTLRNVVALPVPQVLVWDEWPVPCRLWLLKAGLCSADLPRLGAYYHPPSNRVVVPVLGPSLDVLFWQARAVDGRQPKYMAPVVDKAGIIPKYGSARAVTLTEDLLSAYKVGKVGEAWSLLGTSPSAAVLSSLVIRGCLVNVWLDPDAAGQKAATKVLKTLRAAGVECRNIVSRADPKLLSLDEIKEFI